MKYLAMLTIIAAFFATPAVAKPPNVYVGPDGFYFQFGKPIETRPRNKCRTHWHYSRRFGEIEHRHCISKGIPWRRHERRGHSRY